MSAAPLDHLALRTLLFAVVAASSPLALASILAVVTSDRGRIKGAAFAIGFVGGQAMFFLLALSLGIAAFGNNENHPTLIAVLIIVFGAALLLTAAWVRRPRTKPIRVRGANPRTEAIRARLASLRPLSALAVGAGLGVGGPKRLSITIAVTAMITESGVGHADAVGLAAALRGGFDRSRVGRGALLHLAGSASDRVAHWRAQHWLVRHKEPLTFYPSAVLGLVLVIDGVVQLVG